MVEMYGHARSRGFTNKDRLDLISRCRSLPFDIIEHDDQDYKYADATWEERVRAGEMIEYPDLMIASAATRQTAPQAVWTLDIGLIGFLSWRHPEFKVFGE
jgi:predicted nucleic acid-binding protein